MFPFTVSAFFAITDVPLCVMRVGGSQADDGGKETESRCAWANKTTTTFRPITTADALAADWLCRRGVEGRVQQTPYSARGFVHGSQELAPQLTGHAAS